MKKSRLSLAKCTFLFSSCIFSVLAFSIAEAVTLPVLSTFDTDTVGLPPAIGGANQPSRIFLLGNNNPTVLVQDQSNGIDTQPIEATISEIIEGPRDVAFVGYSFDPILEGIVRFESTISIDQVNSVSLIETSANSNAGVTRISANALGQVTISGIEIGTYEPNDPFRVRMDVDLTNELWVASVDNELNGFVDDATTSSNQFTNDFSGGLQLDLSNAWFGAARGVIPPTGVTIHVAHDNIVIGAVPIPPAVWLFGSGLLGLIGIARRKTERTS